MTTPYHTNKGNTPLPATPLSPIPFSQSRPSVGPCPCPPSLSPRVGPLWATPLPPIPFFQSRPSVVVIVYNATKSKTQLLYVQQGYVLRATALQHLKQHHECLVLFLKAYEVSGQHDRKLLTRVCEVASFICVQSGDTAQDDFPNLDRIGEQNSLLKYVICYIEMSL